MPIPTKITHFNMISEQSSSLSQHRTIILSPDSLKYLYQKGRQISNKCLVLGNAKYFFLWINTSARHQYVEIYYSFFIMPNLIHVLFRNRFNILVQKTLKYEVQLSSDITHVWRFLLQDKFAHLKKYNLSQADSCHNF